MKIKHHLNLHASIPNFGYISPAKHSLSEKSSPELPINTSIHVSYFSSSSAITQGHLGAEAQNP